MIYVKIPKYRIIPAPRTGIGWVAVQAWDSETGEYRHVTIERSQCRAEETIGNLIANEGATNES